MILHMAGLSERGVYSDQDANVAPGGNRRGTCWRGILSGHIRAENRVELFRWREMTALGFVLDEIDTRLTREGVTFHLLVWTSQ